MKETLKSSATKVQQYLASRHSDFVVKQLLTILDPDLQNHEVIWAAAGTPNAVFELKAADLPKLTCGQWLPLAK